MTRKRVGSTLVWLICFTWTSSAPFSLALQNPNTDPILEGRFSEKDLASRYSWFEDGKQKYTPDDITVEALLPYSRRLSFVVVMGTWCSDSQKHVPAFFKLMEVLHIPETDIALIGVDRNKSSGDPEVDRLHIAYVPTFIVFYNGKEVGRIVENPRISLENDLLQMLPRPTS
jgi:thiol-disulfide isomerase/thioredoxin